MSKPPQGSYPRQSVPYPTQQPVYPTQPNPMQYGGFAPPPQPSGQFNYGGGQYGMPPPPYSETQPPAATSGYNVPPQQFPQQYPSMAPSGQYPTQQYPVAQYPTQAYPPNMVHGSFDPGARFHAGASVNIPPPPPGYAPNTAQAAVGQGQSVNVQQRRAGWFSGGTDGGYTFW